MAIVELQAGIPLEDCPFCGSPAVLRGDNQGGGKAPDHFWAKCSNQKCAVSTMAEKSETAAIEAWNRRTTAAVLEMPGA